MAKKLEIEPILWEDSPFAEVRYNVREEFLDAIRVPPELLNTEVNSMEIALTYTWRRLLDYF